MTQVDLGEFVSCLALATQEEQYDWRLHPISGTYSETNRQLVLLATMDKRDDHSVVEVVTRFLYKKYNLEFPPDEVALALGGDGKSGDRIFRDIGLSFPVMHVLEIAGLTFDRERPVTPIHQMLLAATKVTLRFESPWGGEWPQGTTWSKWAYNYNELLSARQRNLTEDQQRRLEGLALALLGDKANAYHWLEVMLHPQLSGLTGWAAVKKNGINYVEKHLCWFDDDNKNSALRRLA